MLPKGSSQNECFLTPHCTQSRLTSSLSSHLEQNCCRQRRFGMCNVGVSEYLVFWVMSKLFFNGLMKHKWPDPFFWLQFWQYRLFHSLFSNVTSAPHVPQQRLLSHTVLFFGVRLLWLSKHLWLKKSGYIFRRGCIYLQMRKAGSPCSHYTSGRIRATWSSNNFCYKPYRCTDLP